MTDNFDAEGNNLPIKLDSTSNGEFCPIELQKPQKLANTLAHESASSNAKRTNQQRRKFLLSSCGVASTLLAFNSAFAKFGMAGGQYQLSKDSATDKDLADHEILGDEFIFDVQGHFVNPNGDWLKKLP